jgi:hypothetical protein
LLGKEDKRREDGKGGRDFGEHEIKAGRKEIEKLMKERETNRDI